MEISPDRIRHCQHQKTCSGCQLLGQSYLSQLNSKKQLLVEKSLLKKVRLPGTIETSSPGDFGLRDRLDFVYEDGRSGLYDLQKKSIIDIQSCGQLSPALHDFFLDFKKIKWPIKKGSFRLRIGPQKNRGAWLDFSNLDIKNILNENMILSDLSQSTVVELGRHQKVFHSGRLKDPAFHPWFLTANKIKSGSLFSSVSSFTQPSMSANLKIIEHLQTHYHKQHFSRGLEWGAGVGNLSIPVIDFVDRLDILEFNKKDLLCLEQNLVHWDCQSKAQVEQGDFQKQKKDLSDYDFLVLNPARSGLGHFLDDIKKTNQKIFLMSCFLDSWIEDVAKLQNAGFEIEKIIILDQFPQTHHFEILSFLN
jgi:23S rRNA (uracil1939-C5)-methyltransferase